MSTNVDDSKFGKLEVPTSSPGNRSPWVGVILFAALAAIAAAIGFGSWHDHIRGPEYSTVADVQNRGKIDDACFAANPNSVTDAIQCENDNGLGAPSYPWPTTHVWLSAALVFIGILAIGRVYVFVRRMESKSF